MLHTVTAPGCIDFGCWAFEECHALAWVGDPDQRSNQLAPQARLNVRAFEQCRTLRTIGLKRTKYNPRDPHRVIPEGCFPGTGPEKIDLPADFSWIGPAAFEHCTRLQMVDLSRTGIQEIVGGAFASCTQLQCPQTEQGPETHWARSLEVQLTRSPTHPTCLALHQQASFCWLYAAMQTRPNGQKRNIGGGLMWSTTLLRCVPN